MRLRDILCALGLGAALAAGAQAELARIELHVAAHQAAIATVKDFLSATLRLE